VLYISKPRTPKCRKRPKSGPQYRSSLSRPSKGTPGARLGSPPFRPSRFRSAREQLPHIPDARSDESVQDLGPTASSGEFRTVRSRRTRGARLSHLGVSLIAISRSKDQPLPYSRMPKAPLRVSTGSQPVVTWERKELCKGAKGVEFSYRKDHRDLQVPSDPISILFSLGVNEGKNGWLKPPFIH
jgi:hypothetical protein